MHWRRRDALVAIEADDGYHRRHELDCTDSLLVQRKRCASVEPASARRRFAGWRILRRRERELRSKPGIAASCFAPNTTARQNILSSTCRNPAASPRGSPQNRHRENWPHLTRCVFTVVCLFPAWILITRCQCVSTYTAALFAPVAVARARLCWVHRGAAALRAGRAAEVEATAVVE